MMRRMRIVRSHRPDSWTRHFIGEVVWVETKEPHVEVAAVYGSPWTETEVLGWDVATERLTVEQFLKLKRLFDNLVVGLPFLPEECCESVD